MNQLDIKTGGHPFRNDDLVFMQNAQLQTFSKLAKALNPNSRCILQGCVLSTSGSNYTGISEGLVNIDGLLVYVPAQSFTIAIAGTVAIIPTNINASTVVYQDGDPKVVYKVIQGVISSTPVGSENVDWFNFKLFKSLKKVFTPNYSVDFQAHSVKPVKITKSFDTVVIEGAANMPAAISYAIPVLVFTLPDSDLFPKREFEVLTKSLTDEHVLTFKTNGEVWVDFFQGGPSSKLFMNNLTYNIVQ